MIKRLLIPVLCVSLLAIAGGAQDRLEISSSVTLPAELRGQLESAASLPGCGDDGSMIIYADQGKDEFRPDIVRISPNGDLLARIDLQHLPGFTPDLNYYFAPGPNGETYLLLQGSYPWSEEVVENGQHKAVVHGNVDSATELLRFGSTGKLISRIQLQPQLGSSKLAVFSDGTVLIIGRVNPQEHNPGVLVAMLYDSKGTLLREVVLPTELSARDPDRRHATPILIPMAVPGTDRVWLVRTGDTPVLSSISESGNVIFTTVLKPPEGFRIINPRVAADRLFAALFSAEKKAKREPLYAQFDTATGEVTQIVVAPGPRPVWNALCYTPNGMLFINSQKRTLNVLVPAPQETDSSRR
jgi:hypothetical protein